MHADHGDHGLKVNFVVVLRVEAFSKDSQDLVG